MHLIERGGQQNPKTDSVGDRTLVYHTTQHNSIPGRYLLRFSQWNLQESPGFRVSLWGFGSVLLVIWYSIHLGPPVMAPAGGLLEGTGDMKGSGWFGNDDYCMLFFYMMCIYIYMSIWDICIYRSCLLFEYLVVHIFKYNLYFVYRYLYFKGKLYLNFKGFFGVEAMDLSCFEW